MLKQQLQEPPQNEIYRQVKYRWVILAVYFFAALVNSLPAQTFSSINSLVERRFNYSPTVVTLNALIFPVSHPIIAFPANWVLDRFGMAVGCFFGSGILIAGVWLRTFIEVDSPVLCLFGSVLAAIGNIFILNSPSIMATNWFKTSSIPGVISLSVLSNLISVALGASLPGLILTKQSTAQEIKNLLKVQAIIVTVPLVLLMIFLRNRPSIPPSQSSKSKQQRQPYLSSLKKLFKNREYIKIMIAMIFSYGTLSSYLTILDQSIASIDPELDSGQITGTIVISAMFTGIVSTIFFVNRLKATLQYKKIVLVVVGLSFITFSILQLAISLQYTQDIAVIILGICVGFFIIPSTSLLIAYSSQAVFPLGEGSAAGYLFASSQTFGFLLGFGSISFIDKQNKWKAFLILGIHSLLIILAFLAVLATKETLNRNQYEQLNKPRKNKIGFRSSGDLSFK